MLEDTDMVLRTLRRGKGGATLQFPLGKSAALATFSLCSRVCQLTIDGFIIARIPKAHDAAGTGFEYYADKARCASGVKLEIYVKTGPAASSAADSGAGDGDGDGDGAGGGQGDSSDGMTGGAIAGLVIGLLLVAAIVVAVFVKRSERGVGGGSGGGGGGGGGGTASAIAMGSSGNNTGLAQRRQDQQLKLDGSSAGFQLTQDQSSVRLESTKRGNPMFNSGGVGGGGERRNSLTAV